MTVIIAVLAAAAALCLGILIGQQLALRRQRDLVAEVSASAAQRSSEQVLALTDSRASATEALMTPVRDSLARLDQRLGSLQSTEASWQAQLKEQVDSVHRSGTDLRRETASLADALRRPQVRGSWGEMQLRRALELAGVTNRCVFDEQVSRRRDDDLLRPDLVVHLPGEKSVVIDAKVPLDAFLAGTAALDPDDREACFARHARQVRAHVDQLSAKAYWKQFEQTPEFVVLFLPGEAIFAQAVETEPGLIDAAASKKVVLATPTTLIAMLKSIGYAWNQESVAENARDIHRLGTELYDRLATMGEHLDKLGGSLNTAVTSYNKAVGSLETRVLVSARKLHDLDVGEDQVTAPRTLDTAPRPLAAPELTDDARSA